MPHYEQNFPDPAEVSEVKGKNGEKAELNSSQRSLRSASLPQAVTKGGSLNEVINGLENLTQGDDDKNKKKGRGKGGSRK